MKLLTTAFLLLSSLASAQTPDLSTANFSLNQGANTVTLEQKEFQTVYRTDQVPATCYRSEVQGTTTQCHTEYDRSCRTDYEQVCRDVSDPVCESVPRQSCSTQSVCSTENDSVCNSSGCTNIPRRVCRDENQCHTTYDSVCRQNYRRECRDEPRQTCQDIPRQACQQVPNVVQVPYACTQPVQVPIGQELKMHTKAVLNVSLVNFNEVGSLSDVFAAKLAEGKVSFTLTAPSRAYLYQVLSQDRKETAVSATEKLVTYTVAMKATSIQKLNAFLSFQITDPALFYDRLEFGFSGSMNVPFKGHLKLVQRKGFGADIIVIDDEFKSNALVSQGGTNVLNFNQFGVTELRSKTHYITLSLGIDLDALKRDLINPDAVQLIQNQGQPLVSESTSYPNQ